jgi:hypothetical protein
MSALDFVLSTVEKSIPRFVANSESKSRENPVVTYADGSLTNTASMSGSHVSARSVCCPSSSCLAKIQQTVSMAPSWYNP